MTLQILRDRLSFVHPSSSPSRIRATIRAFRRDQIQSKTQWHHPFAIHPCRLLLPSDFNISASYQEQEN